MRSSACWSPGCWSATVPRQEIVDAMVDLPFALPTAVAGIALTAIYSPQRLDRFLAGAAGDQGRLHADRHRRRADLHRPAVRRAHGAAGAAGLDAEVEEAAASLGATRWQTFCRVIFPAILPALLTGFALAFARAVGEYGSVIFIAGNMPMKTEIIAAADHHQARTVRLCRAQPPSRPLMLIVSFAMLLAINLLQAWMQEASCRLNRQSIPPAARLCASRSGCA